jgi:hypothetical protein
MEIKMFNEEDLFLGTKIKNMSNKQLLSYIKNLCSQEIKYGTGGGLSYMDLDVLDECIKIVRDRIERS